MMLQEALHVNVKSFDLVSEITRQDLFSKIELKPVSRLIIFNLANMYNPKLGYSFPGIDKLARCTGYCEKQIKAGIKELFEQGLIVRTEKKIYFTRKFYELLDIIERENSSGTQEHSSKKVEDISSPCHEQIKTKKLNSSVKNKILKFPEGVNYQSAKPILEQIEKDKRTSTNPLEFTREQAIEFINFLPEILRENSFFYKELKKKYDL